MRLTYIGYTTPLCCDLTSSSFGLTDLIFVLRVTSFCFRRSSSPSSFAVGMGGGGGLRFEEELPLRDISQPEANTKYYLLFT